MFTVSEINSVEMGPKSTNFQNLNIFIFHPIKRNKINKNKYISEGLNRDASIPHSCTSPLFVSTHSHSKLIFTKYFLIIWYIIWYKKQRVFNNFTYICSLFTVILLLQVPVFFSVFFGLRKMAYLPVESLTTGGILWFTDLTVPDPYYALPLMTMASLLATLEVWFNTILRYQMRWKVHFK